MVSWRGVVSSEGLDGREGEGIKVDHNLINLWTEEEGPVRCSPGGMMSSASSGVEVFGPRRRRNLTLRMFFEFHRRGVAYLLGGMQWARSRVGSRELEQSRSFRSVLLRHLITTCSSRLGWRKDAIRCLHSSVSGKLFSEVRRHLVFGGDGACQQPRRLGTTLTDHNEDQGDKGRLAHTRRRVGLRWEKLGCWDLGQSSTNAPFWQCMLRGLILQEHSYGFSN